MFCPPLHPPEYYKKPVYISESFVIVNGTKVRCVTYGLSQEELDRIDREIKATQIYKPPPIKVWTGKGGWITLPWDPHLSWYKPFGRIKLPKVRQVFPELISQEILSVQPMTMPSGLLFYLDFYFESKNEIRSKIQTRRF